MALPARAHNERTSAARGRQMVRDPQLARVATKPALRVVPRHRRRMSVVAAGLVTMFGLMIGAAAFQMQVARRQVQIDHLDREISLAKAQYDQLRRKRAELRSPGLLDAYGKQFGMGPADKTTFIALRPAEIATMQQMAVAPDPKTDADLGEELAIYTAVKAQTGGAP